MVDFILLVADEWSQRLPEVVAALDQVGARVQLLDAKSSIIEGSVTSDRLQCVSKLKCTQRLSTGAIYVTEAAVPTRPQAPQPPQRCRRPPLYPNRRRSALFGVAATALLTRRRRRHRRQSR
jgi:hypothetical protein